MVRSATQAPTHLIQQFAAGLAAMTIVLRFMTRMITHEASYDWAIVLYPEPKVAVVGASTLMEIHACQARR